MLIYFVFFYHTGQKLCPMLQWSTVGELLSEMLNLQQ